MCRLSRRCLRACAVVIENTSSWSSPASRLGITNECVAKLSQVTKMPVLHSAVCKKLYNTGTSKKYVKLLLIYYHHHHHHHHHPHHHHRHPSLSSLFNYYCCCYCYYYCRAMLCKRRRHACACVCRPSRSWILSKRVIIASDFFSASGSHTILAYHTKRHGNIPTETP